VFSDRARSKILALDTGWRYSSQLLVDAGADPLDPARDDPQEWLRKALPQAGATRRRHGGCCKYAIPVGRNARERERVIIAGAPHDYPKLNLRQLGLTDQRRGTGAQFLTHGRRARGQEGRQQSS
jgi:hypothetical protein